MWINNCELFNILIIHNPDGSNQEGLNTNDLNLHIELEWKDMEKLPDSLSDKMILYIVHLF